MSTIHAHGQQKNLANNQTDDQIDDLPAALPEIGADDTFRFDCNPAVPCFNRCCSELILPLTPADIMRLVRALGMESDEFIRLFVRFRSCPETGIPRAFLRMVESPDAPCPFVGPAGCGVYADRPSACRAYPLGRGARLSADGVNVRFFMVREEHCRGFDAGAVRRPAEWLQNQGLNEYIPYNDRYMRLLSMVRAGGEPLEKRLGSMAALCLFQLDRFRNLIRQMNIFSRLEVSDKRKNDIMREDAAGDESALDFAFDWIELAIFGQCANLRAADRTRRNG